MSMELRSNRSRSRTPFLQTELEQNAYEVSNHTQEVVKHSYTTRNRVYKSGKTTEEVHTTSIPVQKTERYVKKIRQATSDYSSEDGENEISSSKSEVRSHSSTYGSAPSNGQVKSALQVYKEAGDYWNKYPKTDYTYSIHSKGRIEVAPGIVAMPNMSRRSLHSLNSSQNSFTSSHYDDSIDYEETALPTTRHLEPRSLFRENNNTYYTSKTTSTHKLSIWRSIYKRIIYLMFIVYQVNASALLWIGRSYYKFVSNVLMLDTWLLQRSTQTRRWKALIALFVLPFLLLAGWWMCSSMSQGLQMAYDSIVTMKSEISAPDIKIPPALDLPVPVSENYIQIEEKLNVQVAEEKHRVQVDEEKPQRSEIIVQQIQIDENAIVQKVLSNLNLGSIINQQQSIIESLRSEVRRIQTQLDDTVENWRVQHMQNNAKISLEIDKCCQKEHITKILADLIQLPHSQVGAEDITKWLHSVFVAKYDLEQHLAKLSQNLHADLKALVDSSSQTIMNDVSEKISMKLQQQFSIGNAHNDGTLSNTQVYQIVKEALAVYDADKTGLVDYALESSGGQILSTRCTESYNSKTAVLSVLGFPLWYPSNTPRVVITPGVTPGECWAFQSFPGFLVIQLTANIKISAFSLEHIPKSLMPGGRRDSAPKGFTVYGLRSEKDHDPWQLGKYEYDINGPGLQYFPVQTDGPAFNIVELVVDSNHGNIHYTCLYRFRVHGNLSDEPT